jgi:hypothetical protein
MKLKYKVIKTLNNIVFLKRISIYLKNGSSIKLHLILHDDLDEPHTHPWDFKSLLIIPYKEDLYNNKLVGAFDPAFDINNVNIFSIHQLIKYNHKPFTIVNRYHKDSHRTTLYTIFGIKIPALTIGIYSKKLQLCSFCQEAGYCLSK